MNGGVSVSNARSKDTAMYFPRWIGPSRQMPDEYSLSEISEFILYYCDQSKSSSLCAQNTMSDAHTFRASCMKQGNFFVSPTAFRAYYSCNTIFMEVLQGFF